MLSGRLNGMTMMMAACLLVPAASARGQDALGSGTMLDANLSPLTGGVNRSLVSENYGARNLIITGNVIGGRGFRGSVGYTSQFDFRDELGSDDLFDFRRDSAWSDVTFLNFGNTYQQLRFGQDIGMLEYRRSGYGSHAGDLADRVYRQPVQRIEAEMRLDQISYATTSAAATRVSTEPTSVGFTQDEEGMPYTIHASSFRGLMTSRMDADAQIMGLTTFDVVRLREDVEEGRENPAVGQFFRVRYEDLLVGESAQTGELGDWRVEGEPVRGRVDLRGEPEFRQVLERIAERKGSLEAGDSVVDVNVLEALDKELSDLRKHLVGIDEEEGDAMMPQPPQPPEPGEEAAGVEESGVGAIRGLEEHGIESPFKEFMEEKEEEEDEFFEDEEALPFSLHDMASVLRHGQIIERFATKDEGRFNELMGEAEQRLREGAYFLAEQRFNRALRFSPGHPLATAGLAHAQIGSGLYLSASITLRTLFVYRPEMIGVRYEEALVPDRERLATALEALRGRLEGERDRAAAAFVLAYVGWLLEDRTVIAEGLEALGEVEPDDRLLPLLGRIWLAEQEEGAPEGGEDGAADDKEESGAGSEAEEGVGEK